MRLSWNDIKPPCHFLETRHTVPPVQSMRKYFQASLAGYLIVWLLYSSFLAANPALHLALHDDADHDSHHCAVTLLEKHQVLSADPLVQNAKLAFSFEQNLSLPDSVILTSIDCRLAPSRAPPV